MVALHSFRICGGHCYLHIAACELDFIPALCCGDLCVLCDALCLKNERVEFMKIVVVNPSKFWSRILKSIFKI